MKVRFTGPARADLESIYQYISKHDPAAASRVVAQLIERAWAIGKSPHTGRETDEPNVRVVVAPRLRYFLFYTIEPDELRIIHIRHTSRQRPAWW
jgi:toxin ParE1/3/4